MHIYIDTNVFVLAVEGHSSIADAIWDLFSFGAKNSHVLFTSEVTLAEALVKPFELMKFMPKAPVISRQLTPGTLAADYGDLIVSRRGLTVWPIDRWTLIGAAHIRADNSTIRLPDAIHVATAWQNECSHFVTGDKQLRTKLTQYGMAGVDPSDVRSLIVHE